jgi:hypothetical protein
MITSSLAAGRWQMNPIPDLGTRIGQGGSKACQALFIATAGRQWTNAKSSIIVVALDGSICRGPVEPMSKRQAARDEI